MKTKLRAGRYLERIALMIALSFQTMAYANEPLAGILDALDEAIDSGKALSVQGGLIRGEEKVEFGFGRLEPDGDAAPDIDSAYQIGSITKVFTNLLLAEMVERGKLRYDTTVAEILGDEIEFANPDVGRITLMQLATHTSGLPRIPLNFSAVDLNDPYADYDEPQLLAALSLTRADQPLGNHQAYSNYGAGLLGYLLGRVDGSDYRHALSTHVLDPLGLDSTGMEPTGRPASPWAGGTVVPAWSFDALAGAGALWSTTSDLARLARVMIGTRAHDLKQDLYAGLEPVSDIAPGLSVSPVWHIAKTAEGPVYWHNGGTHGNASFVGTRPTTEEALIVLVAGEFDPTNLALEWFGFRSSEPTALSVDGEVTGDYRLAPGLSIRVFLDEEGLKAQVTGQAPASLTAIEDDWYAFDDADASLHFLRDDGEVAALELVQNGQTTRAPKGH